MRVVIVDDQPLARSGLRSIIDHEPGLAVVAEAADGREGVERVATTAPDVVVMDLRMPVLDGIGATAQILRRRPATRVLVMTTFDDEELVYQALSAGASGFLLKDASPDQMIAAIRTVHRGQAILAPEVTRGVISRYAGPPPERATDTRLDGLTDREREVLTLVARGLSNREIAERLFVGEGTVKTHLSNILTKTGRYSRVHLVALAYETGFVTPPTR
ncbi:MAG: response regulator [Nocardioides sp.]